MSSQAVIVHLGSHNMLKQTRLSDPDPFTCLLLGLVATTTMSGCNQLSDPQLKAAKEANCYLAKHKPIGQATGKALTVSPEAMDIAKLKLTRAQYRQICCRVDTTAEVQADSNLVTHINSPVAGRVVEVHANIGERVAEGASLLSVRSPDVEQAEADLLQQDAQIKSDLQKDLLQIDSDIIATTTQLSFAKSAANRSKQLYDEKIASKADLESATTEYEKQCQTLDALKRKRQCTVDIANNRLKLTLGPYEQRLKLMGLSEAQVHSLITSRTIDPVVTVRSSEAGVVCDRKANIGEMVDTTKDLMTVANFNKVWLTAEVAEKDIAKLTLGNAILLKVDSLPGFSFPGKLDYIADSVNPDTRTLSVRAEVQNPHFVLKPKMFGHMSILVGEQRGLAVPKTALQDADGKDVLYTQTKPGSFKEVVVKTGVQSQDDVEILSGLKPEDLVVSSGSFWLRSMAMKQTN